MANNSLNTQQLLELNLAILEKHHVVEIKAWGYSMFPLLRPGDRLLIRKIRGTEIQKGDIVIVKMPDKWVAHRFHHAYKHNSQTYYVCKGDSVPNNDPPVPPETIIGQVIKCTHPNGRTIDFISRPRKNFRRFTLWILPFLTPFYYIAKKIINFRFFKKQNQKQCDVFQNGLRQKNKH